MEFPSHLGKYTVTALLGRGAMGVVYKGFDPQIKRVVALKTIRKDLGGQDSAGLTERFKREAQAAGRLFHPGLVAVFDYGEDANLAFIAMEYVEGHDLAEYFSRGTVFELKDVVSIMVQLLDALGHAHERGVVHRDIKPANIILTTEGRLKIADFGIARIDVSELTQSGAIVGTPSHMAPEQYNGGEVDGRTDLFAAGVLLFQLLTGQRPYQGSYEQMVYKICHEGPPKPSSLAPGRVPFEFDRIVVTAMATSPEARYQSAAFFRDALLAAVAGPVLRTISSETMIRPVIATGPDQRSATPVPGSSKGSHGTGPEGWDATLLKQVEQQLAAFVGPLARVMVRKAGHATQNLETLSGILAEELDRPDERRAFLQGRARVGSGAIPAGTPPPASGPAVSRQAGSIAGPITPELVEAAVRHLAPHLGPIAKVVAKRAAAHAVDARQFYLLLAENLADPRERAAFLHAGGHVES